MVTPHTLSGLNVSYVLSGIKENSGSDIRDGRTGALIMDKYQKAGLSLFQWDTIPRQEAASDWTLLADIMLFATEHNN